MATSTTNHNLHILGAVLISLLTFAAAVSVSGNAESGTPVASSGTQFSQSGMHNCGTIAMLISWLKVQPSAAASLVRRQPDGSYLVYFSGIDPVRVTKRELAAADKCKLLVAKNGSVWPRVVLTAFVKTKCGSGSLNFRATDWIYPGEIARLLTGSEMEDFEIKPESVDAKGRVQVGSPVSASELKSALAKAKGKPTVAYTNRRIHIWAVLDYDPARSRMLIRNPRRQSAEWISLDDFRQRFQLVVWAG